MSKKISVVILCGGESRRMRQDKGNLKWGNETFLDHIKLNVTKRTEHEKIIADEVLLSLRDEVVGQKFLCDTSIKRVYDRYVGCGPLAGIEAAFKECKNELIFVVACDMPFVDSQVIEELYDQMMTGQWDYTIDAIIPIEETGRMHGLCGLYRREIVNRVQEQLEQRNYRMRDFIRRLQTKYVTVEELSDGENKLRNINTEKDYKHMIEHKNIHNIPICSIVAFSGTGKTTFIVKLLPELKKRGLRVAVMKHDAHDFEIDKEGKDSWKITKAGADVTALLSNQRAVIMENRPVSATDMLDHIENVDLILTEGFKHGIWPKIMLHRAATGKSLPMEPSECMAVVSDVKIEGAKKQFGLEDVAGVAELLVEYIDFICM